MLIVARLWSGGRHYAGGVSLATYCIVFVLASSCHVVHVVRKVRCGVHIIVPAQHEHERIES